MTDSFGLGVVPDWRSDPVFRNRHSKKDIIKLFQLAMDYSYNSSYAPCYYLYRNKSRRHFENVENKYNNIMIPCLKDYSGDPKSPLNGKVYGLFFTASVQLGSTIGQPYKKSPFGDTRLLVPVEFLIDSSNWKNTNLYFADFYCLHGRHHYVTLVVTRRFSEVDKFCWEKLYRLNVRCNPFLYCENHYFEVIDRKFLTVEVLYTHEISLNYALNRNNGGWIQYNVPTIGYGYVTPGGKPKNADCNLCNLYFEDDFNYEDEENQDLLISILGIKMRINHF